MVIIGNNCYQNKSDEVAHPLPLISFIFDITYLNMMITQLYLYLASYLTH